MDIDQLSESDRIAIINGDFDGMSEALRELMLNDSPQPSSPPDNSIGGAIRKHPLVDILSNYSPLQMMGMAMPSTVGVVEPAAKLVTGVAGKAAGDVAGLGALLGAIVAGRPTRQSTRTLRDEAAQR